MSDARIHPAPGGAGTSPPSASAPSMRSARTTPSNPKAARREIQFTRQEIADTVGAIRQRLDQRKEEVVEKLDVVGQLRQRVRRDPLPLVGAAFVVGLAAGLLTGRDEPGYEVLAGDELDEIRRWRRERRRHLRRLERIMEDTVRGEKRGFLQRLRDRWGGGGELEEE